MDLKAGTGSLSCRICSASYQMPIHHLHEPVDVFSEWLDDCEAAERGEVAAARPGQNKKQDMSRVVHDTNQDYDDDEDDDLPDNPMAKGKTGGAMKSGGDATLGLDDSDDDSE
jgi:transcription elongation factor Elf1